MGRPALGRAARTLVGSTKLTAIEAEALRARNGTVHSGLRAAVNMYLAAGATGTSRSRPKKATKPPPAQDVPLEAIMSASERAVLAAAQEAAPRCRIHRAYKVIDRWTDKGQDWSRRRCQDCGHETVAIDHG